MTKVYTFTKEQMATIEEGVTNFVKEHVETKIYPRLTECQKEYISVEDGVLVYKTFLKLVEEVITTDDLGGIDGNYMDTEPITEITEKFLRCIKAIKRGSEFKSWSNSPNFGNGNFYNMVAQTLKEDFESRFDIDSVFKENNLNIRGKNRKSMILNVVFNLKASCDKRNDFLMGTVSEEDEKAIKSIVKVSELFNQLVK